MMPVMNARQQDDDFVYRGPVAVDASTQDAPDQDVADIGTLIRIAKLLQEEINALHKDFNAFDILELLKSPTLDEALKKHLIIIMSKQQAYDILAPILEMVRTAISGVDDKYKQR